MKKFAVVLSGCGVFDGSEINEVVLCLLAMSKLDITYELFAPDIEQYHVVNHLTEEITEEKRNVLVESARIARGKISDLKNLNILKFDALLMPGGFGAAKNLSTYAFEGINMKVITDLEDVVKQANNNGIPIGAICISPVVIAKILGKGIMTVGNNDNEGEQLQDMGVDYCPMDSSKICIDKENKIVTTPAYMNDVSISEVYEGIYKMIQIIS